MEVLFCSYVFSATSVSYNYFFCLCASASCFLFCRSYSLVEDVKVDFFSPFSILWSPPGYSYITSNTHPYSDTYLDKSLTRYCDHPPSCHAMWQQSTMKFVECVAILPNFVRCCKNTFLRQPLWSVTYIDKILILTKTVVPYIQWKNDSKKVIFELRNT